MIIDSSALLAVVFLEPDEEAILSAMVDARSRRISAATWFESFVVIESKRRSGATARLENLMTAMRLDIVSVSAEQAAVARIAFVRFGRGNHPAQLNYGDCFAYALAKTTGEPLLFKGNDFSQTDVQPALAA